MNRGIRQVGEQTFSCLAFMNDLVLLTMSSRCQQHQFTAIELPCVVFNTRKCSTVRIDVHGGKKMWACNPTDVLSDRSTCHLPDKTVISIEDIIRSSSNTFDIVSQSYRSIV
ncbi:hypothetical protein LSAT2_031941, partial [Lamellibrachia satsuma]